MNELEVQRTTVEQRRIKATTERKEREMEGECASSEQVTWRGRAVLDLDLDWRSSGRKQKQVGDGNGFFYVWLVFFIRQGKEGETEMK